MTPGFVIVAYDVVQDRRRSRLHDRLEAVIVPVQKSVFEGPVAPRDLEAVRRAIREEIDPTTDTVRVFHLCARCRDCTELIGTSPIVAVDPEDVIVD